MASESFQDADQQYPSVWREDIPLADLSPANPDFIDNPNPFYRVLREKDPVHHDEKTGLYLVSRYEDIQTVLRDARTFSQELGWNKQFAHGHLDELKAILMREGGGYFPEILLLDPPQHTRIRRYLDKAFSAQRIKEIEPRVQRLIIERIEKISVRQRADGVADFAAPLTISIMCEQLGLPRGDAANNIPKWARAYTAQLNPLQTREEMLVNAKLICALQQFIIGSIEARRKQRRDDTISDLIYTRLESSQDAELSYEETVALTRGLLLAGNDTSTRALSNFMFMVAWRPDLAEQLYQGIDDDAHIVRFVEELLRFAPPVRGLFRVTTKEVELGGRSLPEGAHVMILFASGNDDAAIFPCPRKFDPTRKNAARHLSFGGGMHFCAGVSLAKMELKIAVRETLKRLKEIKLAVAVEDIRYVPSPSIRAIESLPLTFARRI
jgi:cytochrome P450